jgi:hypothetical protein
MISKNGFVFELSMMLQYLTFIRDLLIIIIINKDNIKIIKNRKQLITWILYQLQGKEAFILLLYRNASE